MEIKANLAVARGRHNAPLGSGGEQVTTQATAVDNCGCKPHNKVKTSLGIWSSFWFTLLSWLQNKIITGNKRTETCPYQPKGVLQGAASLLGPYLVDLALVVP